MSDPSVLFHTPLHTRFAPSPTGHLHLGHAYAALFAFKVAQRSQGTFSLRIEDIDKGRCRDSFVDQIYKDLKWLGLSWTNPVFFQSQQASLWEQALKTLHLKKLLYPCFCTRSEIQAELRTFTQAPHAPEGPIYPGTCRSLSPEAQNQKKAQGVPFSWRLNMQKAHEEASKKAALTWTDIEKGTQLAKPERFGDIIIARKGMNTSYHLAVVLDDAAQKRTLITRGNDLFEATDIHRLLQILLDLPEPLWWHHRLILDEQGQRLAKRKNAPTLKSLKEEGIEAKTLLASLTSQLPIGLQD